MEFITKEKSVEGKRMPRTGFGAHTSQGLAPAVENKNPTQGILTTHKPEKEGGDSQGVGEVVGHRRQ